jgi:hypothetical protein
MKEDDQLPDDDLLSVDLLSMPVPLLRMDPILAMYPGINMTELSNLIDIDRKQLTNWQTTHLTLALAEKIADKVGRHPSNIWGPEYHIVVHMTEILANLKYEQKKQKQKLRRKNRNEKVSTTASGK